MATKKKATKQTKKNVKPSAKQVKVRKNVLLYAGPFTKTVVTP